MSQISFVRVVIGDARKHTPGDQYSNSRRAEVELHSTVEDGETFEDVLVRVRAVADLTVDEILSGAVPTTAPKTADASPARPSSPSSASVAASVEVLEEKPAKKPAAKKKAGRPPGAKNKKAAAKAAAVVEAPIEKPELPEVDDGQDMGLDDVLGVEVPVVEVTDQDLTDATMKKNEHLKDPGRIRELIGQFVPGEGVTPKVRDIPASHRASYLEQLEALE